jgi:hypothetical protein
MRNWGGRQADPVRAELVEALSFLDPAAKKERHFDKLSANG